MLRAGEQLGLRRSWAGKELGSGRSWVGEKLGSGRSWTWLREELGSGKEERRDFSLHSVKEERPIPLQHPQHLFLSFPRGTG